LPAKEAKLWPESAYFFDSMKYIAVFILGVVLGLLVLSPAYQRQRTEIERITQAAASLEQSAATAADEARSNAVLAEEVARLRKDNEDLLRLRNEVRSLRDERTQLGRQIQSVEAQVRQAQERADSVQAQAAAQVKALSEQANPASLAGAGDITTMTAEQRELFMRRYGLVTPNEVQETARMGCLNSLRQIDAAKQQWALENKAANGATVGISDIAPYLRRGFPVCPVGGSYTLNPVGIFPVCNIPGHAIPPK